MTARLLILSLTLATMPVAAQTLATGTPTGPDAEPVITKQGSTTIVNTTTLAQDVEGYAGPTPLRIFIKGGKVQRVEALDNLETPKYFALIKRDILPKWDGLTVKKAAALQVDAVTGATYSSEAVVENVRRGLDYFSKKKK